MSTRNLGLKMHISPDIGSADPAAGLEIDAAVSSEGSQHDSSDGDTGDNGPLYRGWGDMIDRIMKSFCASLDDKISAIRNSKEQSITRKKKKAKITRTSDEGHQVGVRSAEQPVSRIEVRSASAAATPGSGTPPNGILPPAREEPTRTRARLLQPLIPPPAPSAPPVSGLSTLRLAPPAPAPRALAADEVIRHAGPLRTSQTLLDTGSLLPTFPDLSQSIEPGSSGPPDLPGFVGHRARRSESGAVRRLGDVESPSLSRERTQRARGVSTGASFGPEGIPTSTGISAPGVEEEHPGLTAVSFSATPHGTATSGLPAFVIEEATQHPASAELQPSDESTFSFFSPGIALQLSPRRSLSGTSEEAPIYADLRSERTGTPGHQVLSAQTATIVSGPEVSIPDFVYTASAPAEGQFPQEALRAGESFGYVQPHRSSENAVEEDQDGDGRRKRTKRAPLVTAVSGLGGKKFACPYFKRNPRKYRSWTSCPGPGWEEVHRVKTHLYRRHPLPIQCPRCWDVFKTDGQLQAHLQQDPPCAVQTLHTLHEGFTKDQEKRLRSRKKTHADMTDEDKWREIYMVLFPDDNQDSIPSPYYTEFDREGDRKSLAASGFLEDYATFIRREMPTLVRRELEALFCAEFQDVEERVRPRIAEIILELQPKLLSLYRQSQMPLSAYGPEQHGASARLSEPSLTPSLTQTSTAEVTTHTTPDTDTGLNSPVLRGTAPKQYNTAVDRVPTDAESHGQGLDQASVIDAALGLDWDFEFDNLLDPALWRPEFAETYAGVR